ncbi:MAG: dihydrodipicolinate reductase, partial [Actinomycetota bacterium]
MAADDGADRIRVVQWATGNIGTRALREVVRDPGLELVGVLVYDPAKAGVDAGLLCGEDPVGVVATTEPDAVLALGADCVLYMPRVVDVDHLERMLEAGTDVVTTCVECFDDGRGLTDAARTRIAAACERSGASLFATGSSPGFISHMLPITLLSLQRRVDLVEIFEYANMSRRDSPHMLFEQIGFGQVMPNPPPPVKTLRVAPAVAAVADAAGRPADTWTFAAEAAAARADTPVLAGAIA